MAPPSEPDMQRASVTSKQGNEEDGGGEGAGAEARADKGNADEDDDVTGDILAEAGGNGYTTLQMTPFVTLF